MACAGAVVAAGFTTDKIVELKNNSSLVEEIKGIDQNIQIRLDATVAVALASGLVIPLGLIMIIISLCNINFGTCAKVMAVMVSWFISNLATSIILLLLLSFGHCRILQLFYLLLVDLLQLERWVH